MRGQTSASAPAGLRRDSLRMNHEARVGGPDFPQMEPTDQLDTSNRRLPEGCLVRIQTGTGGVAAVPVGFSTGMSPSIPPRSGRSSSFGRSSPQPTRESGPWYSQSGRRVTGRPDRSCPGATRSGDGVTRRPKLTSHPDRWRDPTGDPDCASQPSAPSGRRRKLERTAS